jgi:hypothetical protein
MQVSQLVPSLSLEPAALSALLTCPDFRDGLERGQRLSQEEYEDDPAQVPQTEEALVAFVNWELSTQMYRREKIFEQLVGGSKLSYVHHIGFVVGYLNHLMATGTLWPTHALPEQPVETQEKEAQVAPTATAQRKRGKSRCCRVPKYPNRLRAYIQQEGYTIREVARETAIPESTLRHWVAGDQVIPHAPAARGWRRSSAVRLRT